ncbi:hypothetical protein DL95DRAFT_385450 [Leptodontidium sp. 2 PMI_412]|nr:hypothetical protein DL95DRAFT_385450 [Leptodontidium sp. 2 PMI_412]
MVSSTSSSSPLLLCLKLFIPKASSSSLMTRLECCFTPSFVFRPSRTKYLTIIQLLLQQLPISHFSFAEIVKVPKKASPLLLTRRIRDPVVRTRFFTVV